MKKANGRTGNYDVGYGKPPAQTRFAKGRSGNPKGRPKKAVADEARQASLSGLAQLPASQLLIEEAYRMVMIREGENVISIPAIQAVFRAMGVSAMKGNRFAQRTIAELVQQVETAKRHSREEYVKAMIEYKTSWERKIEAARQQGRPEPQPVPHPDDIIVDPQAGTARVCGPMTDVDKRRWDEVIGNRDKIQEGVTRFAQAYRKARKPERKEACLRVWLGAQKAYDCLNDNLPRRYRKDLTDRSRAEGASRPGDHKQVDWQDE